tara:strand:- start:1223 stop:1405 length:183 start_codon:yes stop_codon:yes gene_type:complete
MVKKALLQLIYSQYKWKGKIMPFESERQRKYLWKNHPKIARDWTNKYGSKTKKKKKKKKK